MSLRDIKDDLLSLRGALYQRHPAEGNLQSRIGAILEQLTREAELQEAEYARRTPKLPLPPGWSFVLVRKALPLSDSEMADAMRDVRAGLEPGDRPAVRYRDALKVTSPSGIVTECHDDEDRYAKLLEDRDSLLEQLKAVEAARDAERDELAKPQKEPAQANYHVGAVEPSAVVVGNPHGMVAFRAHDPKDAREAVRLLNKADNELARERAENLNLRAKAALDAEALPFEGDDMTVRSALEGAWLKGIEAGAEMAVMPRDVVEGDVKAALDAFIRDHAWTLELRVKRRWAREQAYVAGLAKAQDELESERAARERKEPDVERWVVSEIDVDEEDRSYYDLHVGDFWTCEPRGYLLRRPGAKGALGISREPNGAAMAPFLGGRKVTFVRDVTGAEPPPELERAPEIIKQVELSPTRGYDPALERRAEALAAYSGPKSLPHD